MDRLDLRLVDYFVAVAEELHFGRAAARLYIAQPSLSQAIRKLERDLGFALLIRDSRHVELTPAGQALLREGRRVLAQARRAVEVARAEAAEYLVVGFYGSAGHAILPEVLRRFDEMAPSTRVVVRELELSDFGPVVQGAVDVAFTRLRPGEAPLEVLPIGEEGRCVVVPAGHRLASRSSVRIAELAADQFITGSEGLNPAWRAQWLAEQRAHGLEGAVAAEANSVQEILALVSSGRGVCLVPAAAAELYPRSDVVYVTVEDAEPATISLAWAPAQMRAALETFIELARGTSRSSLAGPLGEA